MVKIFHYISAKNEKEKEMERSVYCCLWKLLLSADAIYASNMRVYIQNGIQLLRLLCRNYEFCNEKTCA